MRYKWGIEMNDYSKMTQEDFYRLLADKMDEQPASSLLTVPGVYEAVSEEFNNDILSAWEVEQKTLSLTYYQDPGHGWVKVKKGLIKELGLWEKITFYSYEDPEHIYLEEDCDLSTFMRAAEDAGYLFNRMLVDRADNDSHIRGMNMFRGGWKPNR